MSTGFKHKTKEAKATDELNARSPGDWVVQVLIYVFILVPRGLVALKQSDDWLISQRENPSGGEQHE